MRLGQIKTEKDFSNLITSAQTLFEMPSLTYTTLHRFSEIPSESSSIKHCKNYLDTYKDPLEDKYSIDRRQIFSKSVQLERSPTQHNKKHKNYERMISYSVKKQNIQDIQLIKTANRTNVKKDRKRLTNLKEIISNKMISELIKQNSFANQDEIAEDLLRDSTTREELFEESILMDRLISIRKQEQPLQEPRKTRKMENKPKHFHLNENHRDFNTFYRRKFVKQCVLFSHQNKISGFETSKLRKQQQQSRTVMRSIMKHYSKMIKTERQQSSILISETIKRLFLHYAIKEGSLDQTYKFITKSKLIEFLKDFNFSLKDNPTAQKYLEIDYLNDLDFAELLYSLNPKGSEIQRNISEFLKGQVIPKSDIYIPSECLRYEEQKQHIDSYFKINKVDQQLQQICRSLHRLGGDCNGVRWLNFDDLHELLLVLKIYPTYITKSRLKYYYLYCQSINKLIKLEDVKQVIAFISLVKEEQSKKVLLKLVSLIRRYSL